MNVREVCVSVTNESPPRSQNEKAYQKQRGVFQNSKKVILGQVKKETRFVRNVGLGFKTPREVNCHLCLLYRCVQTVRVSVRVLSDCQWKKE